MYIDETEGTWYNVLMSDVEKTDTLIRVQLKAVKYGDIKDSKVNSEKEKHAFVTCVMDWEGIFSDKEEKTKLECNYGNREKVFEYSQIVRDFVLGKIYDIRDTFDYKKEISG